MRKPVALLVALLGLAFGGVAAAQIVLQVDTRLETADCASGGSSIGTTKAGKYLLRVTDKDTFICWAATCATGGEKFPLGTVVLLRFPVAQALSCRSSDSTGDAALTWVP